LHQCASNRYYSVLQTPLFGIKWRTAPPSGTRAGEHPRTLRANCVTDELHSDCVADKLHADCVPDKLHATCVSDELYTICAADKLHAALCDD
jgi:hypothetical protein